MKRCPICRLIMDPNDTLYCLYCRRLMQEAQAGVGSEYSCLLFPEIPATLSALVRVTNCGLWVKRCVVVFSPIGVEGAGFGRSTRRAG